MAGWPGWRAPRGVPMVGGGLGSLAGTPPILPSGSLKLADNPALSKMASEAGAPQVGSRSRCAAKRIIALPEPEERGSR